MTAKEFLQQVYIAHREIDAKLEQISRLQADATRTTTVIRNTPCGGSLTNSRIESAVVKLHDKTAQLANELERLVKVIGEVSAYIARVKNADERVILEYRYLCFFSWQKISEYMSIGLRQVFKIHNAALKNFPSQFS